MKILRKLCKLSLCAKSFPAGSLHAGIALVVTILLLTDSAKGQTSAARPPTKPTSKLTTNKRSFEIPFSIDASDQNIVEVVLHESQNGGRNWREYATKNPAAAKFQFECSQDGEYWFALQTTNRNGQKSPASRFRPELRIIVDTQQPLFEFEVRPDAAGRLVAQWTASDPNLDPNSLEISYQSQSMSTSPNATWIQVPTASPRTVQQGLYQDQLAWWPKTASRSIQVRALIRDHAGNATAVMRQTVVPQVAQQSVPVTVPKVAGTPPPTPAASSAVSNSLGARASSIKTNLNNKIKRVVGYQPAGIPAALSDLFIGGRTSKSGPRINAQNASSVSIPQQVAVASGSHDQPQPPAAQNRLAQNSASGDSKPTKLPDKSNVEKTTWRSRVRSNDHVSSVTQSSTQDWKSVRGDSNLDVNTSVVHASHNSSPVSQRGAGGLLTKDEGQRTKDETKLTKDESQQSASRLASNQTDRQNNTMQWASSTTQHPDANRQNVPQVSPAITAGAQFEQLKQMARPSNSKRFQLDYDIDAVGPEGVRAVELWVTSDAGKTWRRWDTDNDLRSPINVQLDTEGIFGFRILVVSNAGLRTKTPRSGEPADMWVNVDTTQPDAKITGAPYGRGAHAGKLLIHWQASDTNLALRPIKLQFSPRSSGPWTTIKDGLRNQGEYVWKPGMDIPDQIFLRLEARDTAGNVRVHQLASPIDVSGLIPRGHIRGITPIPSPSPENGT